MNQKELSVPDWIEPYRKFFYDTGFNTVEELINDLHEKGIIQMTFSEFNLIQSLVCNKILDGDDPHTAFEEVKDLVFPRKNIPTKE